MNSATQLHAELARSRVVVVGASSGLGRCIGTGLVHRGYAVAFLGRRTDRLDDAVGEAGGGAVALTCDVRDSASCTAAIEEACDVLGGVDGLVYSAGVGPLVPLVDTGPELWREVFDTNVIGATVATAAALPHLAAEGGRAVYLSSVSASMTPPWPGLGAYAVSKAALDKLVEAWRVEHPEVGFTRLVLGNSAGGTGHGATEFTSSWDAGLASEYIATWMEHGHMSGAVLDVDEIISTVVGLFESGADIPSMTLMPPPP
ncbi:MAG: SDR family oxidoreductase [Acidimicrobiia bacterium]